MFFPDVLKFFNRLGVRSVNDVTAQVTADVTAGMDPEGMGAHMGLEQTLVPAELVTMPKFIEEMSSKVSKAQHDIDMSTKVSMQQFNEKLYIINDNTNNTYAGILFLKALTVNEVARLETKFDSGLNVVKEKENELEAKLDAAKQESDAKLDAAKKESDAKIDELKTTCLEMQATVNSLKSELAKAPKRAAAKEAKPPAPKQPRLCWSKKDHPELPKNIFFKDGTFGFKKTINKKQAYKSGFKTIDEAKAALALHLNGGPSRDIASMMGGE